MLKASSSFWMQSYMCSPFCVIFVLGGPVFIVGPAILCPGELRLQALFRTLQECPPFYSRPD